MVDGKTTGSIRAVPLGKQATPLLLQATASQSMMHERERRRNERLDDQWEAANEVIARTAGGPHLNAVLHEALPFDSGHTKPLFVRHAPMMPQPATRCHLQTFRLRK
jgi:hypothetical protein